MAPRAYWKGYLKLSPGIVSCCAVSRSERDAVYPEVGTRAGSERVHYPDVDFMMERDGAGRRYFRKSGEPMRD